MRIEGLGYTYYPPIVSNLGGGSSPQAPIVSKDMMLKLLNLTIYNQAGMAFKLARIAAQMYAGMNLDYQA